MLTIAKTCLQYHPRLMARTEPLPPYKHIVNDHIIFSNSALGCDACALKAFHVQD